MSRRGYRRMEEAQFRSTPEAEKAVAEHLGVPNWRVLIYEVERQNRDVFRPYSGYDGTHTLELFVCPYWTERIFKQGWWRGMGNAYLDGAYLNGSAAPSPYVVTRFHWARGDEESGTAELIGPESVTLRRGTDGGGVYLESANFALGLYVLGATWLSHDHDLSAVRSAAERHATTILGVK